MSDNSKAGPAAQQDPPKSPTTTKREKTVLQDTPLALAERLLAAGVPVVVCTPCPGYGKPGQCNWRGHEKGTVELHQPKGWPRLTADQCDLSGFRPGVDTLAMVSGHGIDLVDVDTKADGSVSHLPPFASYGKTRTPSGGEHYVVPSSGFAKVSPFNAPDGRHVGDYVGGRADGTGRLLGYLPGSSRPKYPGGVYVEEVPWDIDGCLLVAQPDPALVEVLKAVGGSDAVHEEYVDDSPLRPVEEGVHPMAQAGVRRALEQLDSLPPTWSDGDHWDDAHHRAACLLQRYANSNWTGYTLEQAEADYLEHSRRDEGWGDEELDAKWDAARATVSGGGFPPPPSAADDFADEPLPPLSPEQAVSEEDAFLQDVEKAARALRVRKAAQELLAREQRAEADIPEPTSLAELLEEPDEAARFRVDGLMPTGGRVVFAAPHKAGKTTMISNLVRCLVDGGDFLGRFTVEPAQRVVLLDNELDRRMIRSWLRDQAIDNTKSVDVLTLRGKLSGFNILDPVVRSEWAARLGPADLMVFDCLRPALDALGLSEDKDAGRFLVALDELMDEAGIGELVVVHHMGHSSERSRGDSRILDWPDAIWKLVKADAEDHSSARFISAYGRDVDLPESQLAYDAETRRLSLCGGSRRQAQGSAVEAAVFAFVQDHPGCSGGDIERGVQGDNNAIRQARKNLIAAGLLREVDLGRGRPKQHYLGDDGASDFTEEEAA
jgi:hypothetical protein